MIDNNILIAILFILFCSILIIAGGLIVWLISEHKAENYNKLSKWIYLYSDKDRKWKKYECDNCYGQLKLYANRQLPIHCPKCGAKMKGVINIDKDKTEII